jgi:prevent-host-death family protein
MLTATAEITSSELGARPATHIDRARVDRTRIVVTRNGRRCAAIVPLEDLARLERAAEAAGAANEEG